MNEPAKHDIDPQLPARKQFLTVDIKGSGYPLDPHNHGSIIKPGELVDIDEITPLRRNEHVLFNQLLAHSWETITDGEVHRIRKSSLRGSHESNDRLNDAFDALMGAWAKVRYIDRATGEKRIGRVHLLGANSEQLEEDGYFYYKWPPELLAIIKNSTSWARLKSHILYCLRSKYAIRLYELIEKRINLDAQSQTFDVDELRGKMGVEKGKLPRFSDFNKHCLQPARDEVNQMTDFTVSLGMIKKGRSVVQIQIMWFKKEGEELQEAFRERERHSAGRSARRKNRIEVIK